MTRDESPLEELYESWSKEVDVLIQQLQHSKEVLAPLMNPVSSSTVDEAINTLRSDGIAMQRVKDAESEYLSYLRLDKKPEAADE